jgi:ABC-2 type transport system ATP-binding protein
MTDDDGPVVAIDGLTVRYARTTAVAGLDLEVEAGSVYALLGRNGAGKTSTVACLLGQRRAHAGTVRLFGRDVWRHRAALMGRVGVVPERAEVPPGMTGRQLERFFAALYPEWSRDDFTARLRQFEIPLARPYGTLSKGQQRQLSLALALASKPQLLVLDDPTLGLDAVARRELLEELIGELADRGTTVFVATNDIAGIEGVADRVGILRQGSLVVDEQLETLRGRFRRLVASGGEPGRAALSRAGERFEVMSSRAVAGGVEAVVTVTEAGPPPPSELAGARLEPMSLEEIFVALCGPGNGRES